MKRMLIAIAVVLAAGCSSSESGSGSGSGTGGTASGSSGGGTTGDATGRFLGTWTYAPDDADAGVNTILVTCPTPDGGTSNLSFPRAGAYTITVNDGGLLSAAVTDGCTWTYTVSNDQAVLSPTPQTCVTGGNTVQLEHNVLTRVDSTNLHETADGHLNVACTLSLPDARLTGP